MYPFTRFKFRYRLPARIFLSSIGSLSETIEDFERERNSRNRLPSMQRRKSGFSRIYIRIYRFQSKFKRVFRFFLNADHFGVRYLVWVDISSTEIRIRDERQRGKFSRTLVRVTLYTRESTSIHRRVDYHGGHQWPALNMPAMPQAFPVIADGRIN